MSNSFFFFQAEDGIRYIGVTGVQTCALPILTRLGQIDERDVATTTTTIDDGDQSTCRVEHLVGRLAELAVRASGTEVEIGRASCRERVEISVVAGSLKKKKVLKTPNHTRRVH